VTRQDIQLEDRIKRILKGLDDGIQRDLQTAAHSRAMFLTQAETIAQEKFSNPLPESNWLKNRLINWRNKLQNTYQRKELKPMMTTLVSLLITLTMIVSGAGATVYAAQGSVPDEPLYQLKMYTEQIQLQLATQENTQLELALKFSKNRLDEVGKMLEEGKQLAAETQTRLEQQIEYSLQLAAGMDSEARQQAFQQIKTSLQQQEQTMAKLQAEHPNEPLMEQMRLRLREQLQLADMGLSDPEGLLLQIRLQQQIRNEVQLEGPEEQPVPGSGGTGNGQGQPPSEPPQDGSNPGTGPQTSPEPGIGPGPGPGPVTTSPPPLPGDNGSGGSGQGQPPIPPGSGNGGSGQGQPPQLPPSPGSSGNGSGGNGNGGGGS